MLSYHRRLIPRLSGDLSPHSILFLLIPHSLHRNLDERTREVYRENVRMSKALALHMAREEELQRKTEKLEMANRSEVN